MTLHTDYRPADYDEVIGQEGVTDAIRSSVESGKNRSLLFHGPSGVGKTTLARIVAKHVGCEGSGLMEVDAASNSGVDNVRELTKFISYKPLKGENRVILLDECHMLSKAAWNALLKAIEEPPKHLWWILCTTERHKVPKTIETRCTPFAFQLVDEDDLLELLESVNESEKLKCKDDVMALIAEESLGSPRRALTYLAACHDAKNIKAAMAVIGKVSEENEAVLELARLIAGRKKPKWTQLMKYVQAIPGGNAEGARIMIFSYLTSIVVKAKNMDAVLPHLEAMDAFSEPYPTHVAGMGPLILSIAELYNA